MMGSAIVAMAITDSFTHGSDPKSENTWFKCSKPYLKSKQSSLISKPPKSSARDVKSFTTGRACSSSCHNKSAPPKLPAVTLKI